MLELSLNTRIVVKVSELLVELNFHLLNLLVVPRHQFGLFDLLFVLALIQFRLIALLFSIILNILRVLF